MDVDKAAKIIWEYMLLRQPLKKCDAIFVLGSRDERVAGYAAKLFHEGYGRWLVISGGVAHTNDLLRTSWGSKPEAEHFSDIAIKAGVPEDKIIIENKAANTGQNIQFTYRLLKEKELSLQSFVLVQKPYMERRTFATFKKQWPDASANFVVTSPPISYKEYFNRQNPKEEILHIMAGDFQRIREYPKLGFQIEQEVPGQAVAAYETLIAAGYDKHLISV